MAERCPASFDETMISGHLDGELTQAAEQKVEILTAKTTDATAEPFDDDA